MNFRARLGYGLHDCCVTCHVACHVGNNRECRYNLELVVGQRAGRAEAHHHDSDAKAASQALKPHLKPLRYFPFTRWICERFATVNANENDLQKLLCAAECGMTWVDCCGECVETV